MSENEQTTLFKFESSVTLLEGIEFGKYKVWKIWRDI